MFDQYIWSYTEIVCLQKKLWWLNCVECIALRFFFLKFTITMQSMFMTEGKDRWIRPVNQFTAMCVTCVRHIVTILLICTTSTIGSSIFIKLLPYDNVLATNKGCLLLSTYSTGIYGKLRRTCFNTHWNMLYYNLELVRSSVYLPMYKHSYIIKLIGQITDSDMYYY